MVLSKVNKSLVGMMTQLGLKAVGISGKDAGLMKVKKKLAGGKDIGYVGEVIDSDSKILDTLIDNDFIPVIAPIGMGEDFHGYNINADDAACAIATAIQAEKLVFLTDIEGVFVDPTDKKTLISEMDINEAQAFIDSGVVGGGMLPKLQNCIEAMKKGVSRVHILDGRVEHCLLLEFFTEKGIGTAILKESLF
jgi:acetylglutamate kinase